MSDEGSHIEPVWGFWISVKNKPSAYYAAKMSGLPVFLLGLSFLVLSLLSLLQTLLLPGSIMLLAAIFFIVAGLRMRSGKFGLLPFTVGLWLFLMIVGVIQAGFTLSTIINLLIGLLAVSGLRGWWWLRKNQ